MQVKMALLLPRDSRYVGLLRDVAGCVLSNLSAPDEARDDIKLALTEACANAVKHAVDSDEYSVSFTVTKHECEIRVSDFGPGFVPPDEADVESLLASGTDVETGRGLLLMRALVDDLRFAREGGDGTDLRMVKRWDGLALSLDGRPIG